MNPVVLVVHNNLHLTKQAVASVFAQDIPVDLWLVNNGSTDGTQDWLRTLAAPAPHSLHASSNASNVSPVRVVNFIYSDLFQNGADYVLTMNSDQILPSNCYREMLRWPRGVVSATDVGENTPEVRPSKPVSENTPFVVILFRRWAYDALVAKDGYFYDEGFWLYASDCDLAVRIASCGIHGVQIDTSIWHYGSATIRLAPAEERRAIELQADRDREYFLKKWGFPVDKLEYGMRAIDPLWKACGT